MPSRCSCKDAVRSVNLGHKPHSEDPSSDMGSDSSQDSHSLHSRHNLHNIHRHHHMVSLHSHNRSIPILSSDGVSLHDVGSTTHRRDVARSHGYPNVTNDVQLPQRHHVQDHSQAKRAHILRKIQLEEHKLVKDSECMVEVRLGNESMPWVEVGNAVAHKQVHIHDHNRSTREKGFVHGSPRMDDGRSLLGDVGLPLQLRSYGPHFHRTQYEPSNIHNHESDHHYKMEPHQEQVNHDRS